MKLTLTRLQALELQGVCKIEASEQNHLKAIDTFDPSALEFPAFINYGLVKLSQAVKGNYYNPKISKLLENTIKELQRVQEDYTIPDEIKSFLIISIKKEVQKFQDLMSYGEQSQTFKANISKRADALEQVLTKIN